VFVWLSVCDKKMCVEIFVRGMVLRISVSCIGVSEFRSSNGRSNDRMSKVRIFLVISSPSMEALYEYVIFEIFRDFLQLPSQKCWNRRTYLKRSRHYVLRKQELLVDASWCNGLGFNTRPLGSFGLLIPAKEIIGF